MGESEATRQANFVTPPTSSATPGIGVTVLSTSGTASSVDLFQTALLPYEGYFDRYIELTANGGDAYFLFSATAVTISYAANTNATTGTTATQPALLKDGIPRFYRLNKQDHRFLNLQMASGTPSVILTPSSQPGLK